MSVPDSTPDARPLPQIGSYRLIQQLGSGGMSSVFRAIHVETGHEVAVKILPRYLAKNATLLQRFLREAKSAEALEHPNIVAIFDRGSEEGRYYLVLEFVPGGDFHDHVRDKGPLGPAEAAKVLRAVAEGLRYAAAKGLIHRDIKPANLLLSRNGEVKITDLGLALQVEEEDERVTRDGTTVGTVDYMAPEQARDSRATSVRSDIYSLGCTCYYLLTGSPPYAGGDVPEKLRRHAQEPPPDLHQLRPEVPEALAALIQRMMAKRPERRFADYDELISAIDAIPLAEIAEPLYALIDDEDDEVGDFTLAQIDQGGSFVAPETVGRLDARDARSPRPPYGRARLGLGDVDIDLIELAALDEGQASPRLRTRRPEPIRPRPYSGSVFDDELHLAQPVPMRPRAFHDDSLRTWIVRGLVTGVVVVLLGMGLLQLWTLSWSTPTPAPSRSQAAPAEQNEPVTNENEGSITPTPRSPESVRAGQPPRFEQTRAMKTDEEESGLTVAKEGSRGSKPARERIA
jgi:serine/threonine-protein kinase